MLTTKQITEFKLGLRELCDRLHEEIDKLSKELKYLRMNQRAGVDKRKEIEKTSSLYHSKVNHMAAVSVVLESFSTSHFDFLMEVSGTFKNYFEILD